MNLLEPWILIRVAAGLVASLLFARGAWTGWRVLRHFNVGSATEGQLALERHVELAATFVRVAAVVQVGSLALTVLAADRLSHGIRGAMCAYGVFAANSWGFPALLATLGVAIAAGLLAQLFAFDARVRGLDLVRSLAVGTLVLAPLALADLVVTSLFLLKLDLSVVASCCSVQLDAVAAGNGGYARGPRVLTAIGAPIAIVLSVIMALYAARRPRAPIVAVSGALTLASLPLAIGATILEVAPHAFEVPHHVCPFCLLKTDVLAIGYPLFGAILLAVVWGGGAALSGLVARGPAAREAFGPFARGLLRRGAVAWLVALAIGVLPVARYAIVAGGSLFR